MKGTVASPSFQGEAATGGSGLPDLFNKSRPMYDFFFKQPNSHKKQKRGPFIRMAKE